jgi:branched-subunit amino acid transport protein
LSTLEVIITCLGLACITVLTRGFFVLSDREIPLPEWLRQGLRYAPLAALMAVVAPELVLTQGKLISTWQDPRLFGAAAATAYYFWRRGILGTIITGTTVLLVLKLGLGW